MCRKVSVGSHASHIYCFNFRVPNCSRIKTEVHIFMFIKSFYAKIFQIRISREVAVSYNKWMLSLCNIRHMLGQFLKRWSYRRQDTRKGPSVWYSYRVKWRQVVQQLGRQAYTHYAWMATHEIRSDIKHTRPTTEIFFLSYDLNNCSVYTNVSYTALPEGRFSWRMDSILFN